MPTLTSLVSFNGANGSDPQGALVADSQGDLFGTSFGGPDRGGTVFEIVYSNGVYASQPTILASFDQSSGVYAPVGPLVTDSAGNIFGETVGTNAYENGSIFEIQKTASGYATTPILRATFSGSANNITSPTGGLAIDSAGDLFGSASQAGAYGDGAVFEMVRAASGNYSAPQIIASFDGS